MRFSGSNLGAIRRERDLPREAVALAIRRTAATVALYESGRVTPPGDVLARLADALDCSVADFFDAGQVAA